MQSSERRPADRSLRPVLCLLAVLAAAAAEDLVAQGVDEPATEESQVLGAAAAFSAIDEERERVWLPAGSPLFERPDASSSRLAVIDSLAEIEVLERSGDWCLVHFSGRRGWVNPDLPEHLRDIDTLIEPAPVAVVTPAFDLADPGRRREQALEALGLTAPNGRLGPWELLTDVSERHVIDRLDRVAAGLPASFRERYGLEPADPAEQTVALFSTEASYRPFESETSHLAGVEARGHASDRLAALFVEGQRTDEAAALLVHELAHLMGRTPLGANAPPWLEEGIANDLAYSRIGPDGSLWLGSVNGSRIRTGSRQSGITVTYSGGIAALAELLRLRAQHQATPLELLVALDQPAFLERRRRRQHYIESAFLVRFLLDAQSRRYAEGFRAYLEALGGGAEPELLDFLDADWNRIERGLDTWLALQSAQLLH
jgi:hypothetical protein